MRIFQYIIYMIALLSVPGIAGATEPNQISPTMLAFKRDVQYILKGENLENINRQNLLCSMSRGQMLRQELGKLEYNDLFHEIQSEEQANDIREWAAKIEKLNQKLPKSKPGELCNEAFQLWNAYDDKWYAADRAKREAERNAQIEQWKSYVVDTGPEYWDGVINGTFLRIPREYIWFGSGEPDGFQNAVNLRFYYPNLAATSSVAGPYGNKSDVVGVLKIMLNRTTLPCADFENEDVCTFDPSISEFVNRYLDCNAYERHAETPYRGLWRRACGYRESITYDLKPEYDEEVGMWRIGKEGYYEGSPEFPSYWMICPKIPKNEDKTNEETRERCDSALRLNDHVYFYYSFPQRMFWEHRQLQADLRQKLQSFIVNPETQK